MNTGSTTSPTAAAAKVAAIRAYAYPEPAVERAHAPDRCGCPHGPSLWDLYVINQMSQTRCRSASSSGSSTTNNTDNGKPHWFEIVAGVLFLVCAVAASVYDASKLLVLLAMVGEADALVLPLGGQASVLFDRWKRSELAFWWIHSLSICSTALLALVALVARVYLGAPPSVYWALAVPASTLVGALIAYRLLGYRSANRAVLDQVAARLAAATDDDGVDNDRKTR
ncbi:hypothetical protein pdul_cds_19 [Pandoravirus dulcis]|uniref:Uncharacterized protein n=1 Tax=Pandoravirus dulcis TaxID=1349409 RepID=S4VRA3_9VIRU|nr:hypothetical protein pdul_cds_19 [Pandoravirus dulcis]AGO81890.1 hypothetical protein pdul_cds_19 [Pandoravirus dulcis]